MGHQHRGECKGDCKVQADVTCKLCFLPEGDSAFVRVGKYKVQHGDCNAAWTKEQRGQGREQMFLFQIEKVEDAMSAAVEPVAEVSTPAEPLTQGYLDFKTRQVAAHGSR